MARRSSSPPSLAGLAVMAVGALLFTYTPMGPWVADRWVDWQTDRMERQVERIQDRMERLRPTPSPSASVRAR